MKKMNIDLAWAEKFALIEPGPSIYVAGPYTAESEEEVEKNIEATRQSAIKLIKKGWVPFTANLNTRRMEVELPGMKLEDWLQLDLFFLRACDALYLPANWKGSRGCQLELALATVLKKRVYVENIKEPPLVKKS